MNTLYHKCNRCETEKPTNMFRTTDTSTCNECLNLLDEEVRAHMARKYRKKWRENNQHKVDAHKAVTKAILLGVLIRQPCEECGREKSEAHHDDYSKQLDVRWLCGFHHRQHHINEKILTVSKE